MQRHDSEQFIMDTHFEKGKQRFLRIISQFCEDPIGFLNSAKSIFKDMLPEMAYLNDTDHPMAASVFSSCATLSVCLSLKKSGVDVHDFGSAVLADIAQNRMVPVDTGSDPKLLKEFIESGEASKHNASPNEYVFEAFEGDHIDYDWGVNIKRCALCVAFSKYSAMDLVPYMCAMNDVMSDKINQGLRRTGTIGLGAKQCIYRYKIGGEPLRLADQYPERIKYVRNG